MCQMCGGPLELLGKLGRLIWFRCRSCGMQWSKEESDVEVFEEEGE